MDYSAFQSISLNTKFIISVSVISILEVTYLKGLTCSSGIWFFPNLFFRSFYLSSTKLQPWNRIEREDKRVVNRMYLKIRDQEKEIDAEAVDDYGDVSNRWEERAGDGIYNQKSME